tara:strand:+ start:5247 stop:5711 length:465 start_codon:yes stop_codon:yes gene_type:complete
MSNSKPGRTILVLKNHNFDLELKNLDNKFVSNTGTQFLSFKTIEDSEIAFNLLQENNIVCKYSYYKLFFRLNNLVVNKESYSKNKELIISELKKVKDDINVVYFNFFSKNDTINSGSLTLDNITDFNDILNKKELDLLDDKNIVFYKFNNRNNS